jgi:C1A family cysteine protease
MAESVLTTAVVTTTVMTRARGRIDPPNMEERHAMHAIRHMAIHAGFDERAEATLPATYDCTNLCTPVKDQAQCGSCWDFSGTCVVEAANIKAGVLPDNTAASQLSEQYTLDQCDGTNGGCGGDDNTTVLGDAKTGGLPLTSVYGPYQARAKACKLKTRTGHILSEAIAAAESIVGLRRKPPADANTKLYTVDDWGYAGTQTGVPATEIIKAAMLQYGPIGCGVAADSAFENYQSGSVFAGSRSRQVDHDVVLVGWDDSKQAWKMRNSWGTDWGNAGYMWIAYGVNQIGYEAVWAVVAPVTPPDNGPPPIPLSDAS